MQLSSKRLSMPPGTPKGCVVKVVISLCCLRSGFRSRSCDDLAVSRLILACSQSRLLVKPNCRAPKGD